MAVFIKKNNGNSGAVFNLDDDEILIGRNSKCGIVINDLKASKCHARILKAGEYYKIEDMRSSNGTSINGQKIETAFLKNGDRVLVGESLLVYYDDITQQTAKHVQDGSIYGKIHNRNVIQNLDSVK